MSKNNEQTELIIPLAWKPYYREDLIRMGSNHDGGYVVTKNAVNNSNFLVSLGISNDWTFEKEFYESRDCEVHCYDHSIDLKIFLIDSIINLIMCFYPRMLDKKVNTVFLPLRYKMFFKNERKHFKEKIGNNPETETNFEKIFSRIPEDKRVFFKIDIESWEYRVISELNKYHKRISGIIIEFHDVDIMYDSVKKYIDELKKYFNIIHIHINNYGGLSYEKTPRVIEITFENKKLFFGKEKLSDLQYPILNLDSPNDKNYIDYKIYFYG
jgi:hypothetical protein